jgi:peptidoglycan/LPS O-acetylase OafA/YrhL
MPGEATQGEAQSVPAAVAQPEEQVVAAPVPTSLRDAPRALTAHRTPLPALTGLRFFAALHVIIFHTTIKTTLLARGHTYAGNFLSNGFLAVTLFFMLSGFILAYNYRGQIETRSHAVRFWEARYARIWPAYAFSLICSSIPLSGIPHWPVALATLGMVQAWDPFHAAYAAAWNGVCWSLSVEALFYLVFPWLQTRIEKLRISRLALFGLLVAFVAILCNTPNHNSGDRYSGLFFYVIIPIVHLPEFIAGTVLGNLFLDSKRTSAGPTAAKGKSAEKLESSRGSRRARFPVLTIIGFTTSIIVLCATRSRWESLVVGTFSLLLYGLASERSILGSFLSTRALVLGGEISYSMYLLRTPLHTWINLSPVLGASRVMSLLYIPFLLIPLSLMSYFLIEGPSRRGLRRLFATLQGRA